MLQSTLYKYFRHVLCLAAAATLTTACEQSFDDEAPVAGGKGYITLTLNPSGSQATRDVNYAVDGKYNEDKISTVDLFLYPIGGFDAASTQPIVSQRVALTDADGNKVTVQVPEEQKTALFGSPTSGSCYVVAVANCAESEPSKLSDKSVKALSELVTATDQFKQREKLDNPEENGVNYEPVAPRNFVMVSNLSTEGGNILNTINYVNDEASGTISLKRVAAKIRLAIKLPDKLYRHKKSREVFTEIPAGEESSEYALWEPDMDMIRVFFNNGAQKAQLNGELPETMADGWFFNIQTTGSISDNDKISDFTYSRKVTKGSNPENTDYPYYHELPLYSYPNKWQDSPSESHRTMLTLVVPWVTEDDELVADEEYTTYRPMYYQIPVTTGLNIESNKYYFVCANIRMMGSETPSLPLEVEGTCQISDWGTAETDAKLQVVRYLSVNKTRWEMNNENKVVIPFDSSHPVSIVTDSRDAKRFKFTYYTYQGNYGEEQGHDVTAFKTAPRWCDYSIDNSKGELTFEHKFLDAEDYSRIDIYITLEHTDNSAFREDIHITYYPPIYITTELIENRDSSPVGNGWILVNGYGNTSDATGGLGPVSSVTPIASQARCLTTLHVTQFNEEEKALWTLGDPRTNYINNNLSGYQDLTDNADNTTVWTYQDGNRDPVVDGAFFGSTGNNNANKVEGNSYWSPAGECRTLWSYYNGYYYNEPDWSGGTDINARTLKYYYPTAETADRDNIIGPEIMIVSRHAYSADKIKRENARRKCATYQQYGYPAGRWRLPTKGEVELFRYLERKKNKINDIYGGTPFWCSRGYTNGSVGNDGKISVSTPGSSSDAYVRCVYDVWYWKKVDEKGDRVPDRIPFKGDLPANGVPTVANMEYFKFFTWGDRPKENVLN